MAKRPKKTADADTDNGLSREEYFAERSLLIEARQRSFQRAEQMVMGGATGALLLSVTFLEKLAPAAGRTVHGLGWLVAGWVALLACMCISLFSQYAAGWAFTSELARLDAECNGETAKPNKWKARNAWCGGISSVLLASGIAMLAAFAYWNAPFHP